jgi:sugar O-acyltransferase (sialic acid O-acetyltransferase NeuD family)
MIIYGAGGHAKVVYDCLISQGDKLVGVFDDNPDRSLNGSNVMSPYNIELLPKEELIISIGSNKTRYELANCIKHQYGIVKHHTALISDRSSIGSGSMIMANAVIQMGTKIGRHTIINTGAIIEHDSILEDFVHIGPGAVVCGEVKIENGAFIGANATVLPGVKIGEWAVIGAGAVVLNDVEKGIKVAGNPAKIIVP